MLYPSVFHTNPAIDFGFAGMPVTVCDGVEALLWVSVTVYEARVHIYTSILPLDRVSQNYLY
jgi:hypothetical protein